MLQLGYKASAEQFGPRALLEFAVHAEQCGFDSVAVSDHFHPWRHTDGHAPQAFVWLGALCERTRRVRLGTSVTTPTFRYHPAVVAQAAATLALLSGDRFFLGVGTGESMNEVPALGIAWPGFKERFARLAEAIAAVPPEYRAVSRVHEVCVGKAKESPLPCSVHIPTIFDVDDPEGSGGDHYRGGEDYNAVIMGWVRERLHDPLPSLATAR